MHKKSKASRAANQMNLFGWTAEPAQRYERSINRCNYDEWRRSVSEYMWKSWYVRIDEAINVMQVIDEERLREAHRDGMTPGIFVNALAADCEWIDFRL